MSKLGRWWIGLAILVIAAITVVVFWPRPFIPADPNLARFVKNRPPVPIVFTSRKNLASLSAAAPAGAEPGYAQPPLWSSSEGRLRLLAASGEVRELTWNNPLPDGGKLIDVMSPSISLDRKKVLFAGRRDDPDQSGFRLYEVELDGSGLRQLTGGPDDPGCVAAPPLRYFTASKSEGTYGDDERRRRDYDDVDPIELNLPGLPIVFASSRVPDFGGHGRRSTTIWRMDRTGEAKRPLTFNRNNDRWPWLLSSNQIVFSSWSRNREVVNADGTGLEPVAAARSRTAPTDAWMALFQPIFGGQFGMMVKSKLPVWRPRALFNGRFVFGTQVDSRWTIAQAPPGLIEQTQSARPKDHDMPLSATTPIVFADADWRLAAPSPCPGDQIVVAAARKSDAEPGAFGLYLLPEDWTDAVPKPLFDDPDFADAEPVAVYPRGIAIMVRAKETAVGPNTKPRDLDLPGGGRFTGPLGTLANTRLYHRFIDDLPGQKTDRGEGPIHVPPPDGSLHSMSVYASHRDRFDDPAELIVPGRFRKVADVKVRNEAFDALVPADVPLVVIGFDPFGKVAEWSSTARDARGRTARFLALAGDHYSGVRPGETHFCIGCHPGHSALDSIHQRHAERK